MSATRTRSEYGNVEYDEQKIKHIESMTEVTLTVQATPTEPLDRIDVRDIGYDTIRGPIKTRRNLIHCENSQSQITLTIHGYTCTQWHHSIDVIRESLKHSTKTRLQDTPLTNITTELSFGSEHDIHETTGAAVLNNLEA